MLPDVSVIIPAYRASADITVALQSVFAQTFTNFEVIVVNDGSPDTPQLRRALGPYAARISYVELPSNRGAAVARNTGILRARGRYVAFLDADDRWFATFLARQVAYLDVRESCTLVYADAVVSGESALAGQTFMKGAPSDGDVTLTSLIEQRCNVILSTVVIRREALVRAGMFDEGLRRGQDFDLWLRLSLRGSQMAYQRAVLAERRVRATGLSGDTVSELERALNVLDRFSNRYLLDARARTAVRVRMMQLVDRLEIEQGKRRILEGNFAAAQYHLSAARERPFKLRLALMALRVAPRLVRAIYLRAYPLSWRPALATSSR
jgi:glycosyltransferase involved in cell wall biosynthesis